MPRTCTVCSNSRRLEIDQALRAGEPLRAIAARFSLAPSSIHRHKANHLAAKAEGSIAVGTPATASGAGPRALGPQGLELERRVSELEEVVKQLRQAVGLIGACLLRR